MTRLHIIFAAALLVIIDFATIRVVIPALVNMQNDGAIITAIMLPFVVITVNYLTIKNLVPLWNEK